MTHRSYRFRDLTLDTTTSPIMGVVNATHNSFSDAGQFPTDQSRIEHASRLIDDGASIIDVGGQSAVTNVGETSAVDELAAVLPIVTYLRLHHPDTAISVDTYKPLVAEGVLAAGAHIINDTTGLANPELADLVREHSAALVITHNRSRPKERLTDPSRYADVVADVVTFLLERIAIAKSAGLDDSQIVLDPGFDFSKTPHQTVTVLQGLAEVRGLGLPVLAAISRKDFIGTITGRAPKDRLAGTLAAIGFLGIAADLIYRVHDVRDVSDFIGVSAVLQGLRQLGEDDLLPPELWRTGT